MMYRRIILNIILIFICAVISVSLLIICTRNPHRDKGGFIRKMTIPILKPNEIYKFSTLQILDLCGVTKSNYFFYAASLTSIVETDKDLSKVKFIQLSFDSGILNSLNDTSLYTMYIDS